MAQSKHVQTLTSKGLQRTAEIHQDLGDMEFYADLREGGRTQQIMRSESYDDMIAAGLAWCGIALPKAGTSPAAGGTDQGELWGVK
jgi:hypothetical protein